MIVLYYIFLIKYAYWSIIMFYYIMFSCSMFWSILVCSIILGFVL